MTVEFTIPETINANPNVGVATCLDCGAAILIEDFALDARKIHAEWHERVSAVPKELWPYKKRMEKA